MTESEKDQYIRQLEGEVGDLHRAYYALTLERDTVLRKLLKHEPKVTLTAEDGHDVVYVTRETFDAMTTELDGLRKRELELHESLHKAKYEKAEASAKRQELFDAVYSVYCRLMKSAGEELTAKHKAVLAGNSKAAFARAVRLDGEIKELLYGNQDSGRTGQA